MFLFVAYIVAVVYNPRDAMDTLAILAARRSEPQQPHGRPHLWPAILLVLVLMGFAVAFLGTRPIADPALSPTPTTVANRESRVYTITYRFGVFSPTNLRIHAGDTVRWKNDSPLPMKVIAQLQPGETIPSFDSVGSIQPGSYFSYTFAQVAVYGYYNPSDANESGVIIVRE
jgi:plastocyanin